MIEFRLDNLDLSTDDYTIGFWVKFRSYLSGGAVFSQLYEGTADRMPLTISFTDGTNFGSGNVLTIGYFNGSWNFFTIPEFPFNLDQWYHFAVTRNGNILSFFLDGYKRNWMEMTVSPQPNTKTHIIGRRWDTSGTQNYFNGEINDFFISRGVMWNNDFTPPSKFIGKITNDDSNPVRLITGESVDTEALVFPRNSERIFRGSVVDGYYSVVSPMVESDVVFLSPEERYPDLCFSRITPC